MSSGASDSARFREGLEQQWATLDVCFGERVSRESPRLDKYLALRTSEGPKRVCWNSWIAPHNWEGFFLNFGDMLARADDLADRYGERFRPSAYLRGLVERGESFPS